MKVIQSWDDGLVSDIRLIELLRRYQAKATFCLNPGLYQENRSFGWMHEKFGASASMNWLTCTAALRFAATR